MKALLVIILIALAGCAHQHKGHADIKTEVKSEPVEFDGHCAMGLCRKGQKVKCDPEITAAFKGKSYCFSTLEARDTFMKDIVTNSKKAHTVWDSNFGGSKN